MSIENPREALLKKVEGNEPPKEKLSMEERLKRIKENEKNQPKNPREALFEKIEKGKTEKPLETEETKEK
ncbi:MAG: hypothetical protein PHU42_02190 [Patescibacteria group bacterium]|nr:hypothetical protein [Patescibacteria group bacterium]